MTKEELYALHVDYNEKKKAYLSHSGEGVSFNLSAEAYRKASIAFKDACTEYAVELFLKEEN